VPDPLDESLVGKLEQRRPYTAAARAEPVGQVRLDETLVRRELALEIALRITCTTAPGSSVTRRQPGSTCDRAGAAAETASIVPGTCVP
jgi:hypothetical protein